MNNKSFPLNQYIICKSLAVFILLIFFLTHTFISSNILQILRSYSKDTLYILLYAHGLSLSFYQFFYISLYYFNFFKDLNLNVDREICERHFAYKPLFKRTSRIISINAIIIPIIIVMLLSFKYKGELQVGLDQIPSSKEFTLQIFFCLFIEEISFFIIHKLLHIRFIYEWVHSLAHQYKLAVSVTAYYMHPFEFLIAFLLPISLGPLLLSKYRSIHEITLWGWVIFINGFKSDCFSGFDLPFSPFRVFPSYSSIFMGRHYIEDEEGEMRRKIEIRKTKPSLIG